MRVRPLKTGGKGVLNPFFKMSGVETADSITTTPMKEPIIPILAAMLLAAPTALLKADDSPKPLEKPNIVYILADDLGYGDVQSLNPERGKIKTPNVDRLVSQGMSFTDAHAGAAVCTPSRYGILTGRYAWRSKIQKGVMNNYGPPLIQPDQLTVASMLKQQGYYTGIIGKWHLGFTIDGASGKKAGAAPGKFMGAPLGSVTHDGPTTRGFDSYFGFHHARMMKSFFTDDRVTQIIEPINVLPALVTRTQEFIAEHTKRGHPPFFLYLALSSPHIPIVPTPEWQGKSGSLGAYGDFVMETDWAVGQILEAIDKAGIANNTIVMFASDNGFSPHAGKKLLESQGHFPSADRRGYKADIWDGGHRIPFVVRWPGTVSAGSHCDQIVSLVDFMATCADILKVKLPDNAAEDSVSILPALSGTDHGPLHEAIVYHSISGRFAIQQGQWKLELCPGSGGWSKDPSDAIAVKDGLPLIQLYDMTSDVGEQHNMESKHPEIVKRLLPLLEKYIADGRSTPGSKEKNETDVDIWKKQLNDGKLPVLDD